MSYSVEAVFKATGADRFAQAFENAERSASRLETAGSKIQGVGSRMKSVGSALTNNITKPAGVAITAVGGLVGALGFKRLVGLDSAKAKLAGLGYEGTDVERIMDQVTNATKTGMTTLGEGADIAAGALAAGVSEGADLERYIKLVGDAAVGANRPVDEMAQIFNRVQGGGRLMTQELNQIEHGLPGFSNAMAKHLGVSTDEFRSMVTEGKVSSDDFLTVMEDFGGGMAEAMAGSMAGMAKNVLAYVGIIGEALIEGLFEDGKKGMAQFIEVLKSDEIMSWATSAGESIRSVVTTIVDYLGKMKTVWDSLSTPIQNVITKIVLFGSMALIALGPILSFLAPIVTAIGVLGVSFTSLLTPIAVVTGVIVGLVAVGTLLYTHWETLKSVGENVFSSFEPLLERVKSAFEGMKGSVEPIIESLKGLWESLAPVFISVGIIITGALTTLIGVVVAVFTGIMQAVEPIFGMVANLIDIVGGAVGFIVAILMGDFAGAWEYIVQIGQAAIDFFINAFEALMQFIDGFVMTIIDFFHGLYMTLVGNSIIPDMVNEIVDWFKNMFNWLIDIVKSIVDGVVSAFDTLLGFITTIMTGIQTVFTVVWNTIKLVVTTVSEAIRNVINTVWIGIQAFLTSAMNTIKNIFTTVWNAIKNLITTVLNAIKSIMTTVWNGIKSLITTVMNTIKTIITTVWNAIKSIITNVLNTIKSVTTSIWNSIKSVITTVLNAIKSTITTVWNAIKSTVTTVMNAIKSVIETVWNAAKTIVTNAVNAIKDTISRVFNATKDLIATILNAIKDTFSNIFESLKGIVTDSFEGVKSAVSTGMSAALKVVTDMIGKFKEAGSNIIGAIGEGIKGAASKITGPISGVAGKIRGFMPFSPAKEGPLRDIMNIQFGESIAHSIKRGQGKAEKAMSALAIGVNSVMPDGSIDIGSRVGSINKQAERQLSHTFDSSIDVGKQPAVINVHVGSSKVATEIVDDITKLQNRANYSRYKSQRRGV